METMKHKTIYFITIMAVIMLPVTGCKKFIEVEPPVDKLTTAAIFSNDETANAAMRGLYSDMVAFLNYIANGGLTLYLGLSADEIRNTKTSVTYDPFTHNALSPANSVITTNIWYKSYYHIYCANILLENLEKSVGVSAKVKSQITGEAKFLRAFFQFYLLNLFGPTPITVSTNYLVNAAPQREDSASVYKQIVNDLTDAQSILGESYPVAEKVRVNRWAATALLARVHLYQGQWNKAEEEASKVINSNAYQLSPFNSVFLANGSESILQFYSPLNTGMVTAEGNDFIPASSSAVPSFALTNFILDAFEPGDLRKPNWTATSTINGIAYMYPYKYKVRSGLQDHQNLNIAQFFV
jgi:starch-binding outer membrane protein, SusD/RagB family